MCVAQTLLFIHREERLKVGEIAPNFTLPHASGQLTLQQLRGKTVLLNFWATWCPPCVLEMPSLSRLQDLLRSRGFEVVAVSLDPNWGDIANFLKKYPVSVTLLLDERGEVASKYGTFRLPESFLIDREGKIVKAYLGPREWTEPGLVKEILAHVESR